MSQPTSAKVSPVRTKDKSTGTRSHSVASGGSPSSATSKPGEVRGTNSPPSDDYIKPSQWTEELGDFLGHIDAISIHEHRTGGLFYQKALARAIIDLEGRDEKKKPTEIDGKKKWTSTVKPRSTKNVCDLE